jgi:hypothetical protein
MLAADADVSLIDHGLPNVSVRLHHVKRLHKSSRIHMSDST